MNLGKPLAFAGALAALTGSAPAFAAPRNWQLGLPEAASPVMAEIVDLHRLLFYIAAAVFLFLLAILVWTLIRYNRRFHPVPRRKEYSPLLQTAWTCIPVIVLVLIAIPSLRLLYFETAIPVADVTVKAIGKVGFWTYEYPREGDFRYDSRLLDEAAAKAIGESRLLGVDNPLIVPVDRVVEVLVTSADVIHSWSVPGLGVKIDAVPGRINRVWFKALKPGLYYGLC